MVHLDLAPVVRKPTPLEQFLAMRMAHIKQMLLAAAIASGTIILVAAAMMTAF